jgi:anti-anti-sigma factor
MSNNRQNLPFRRWKSSFAALRNAVLNQQHTRMLVIDLARVERIDAGGLGVLLGLRESARSSAIMFKLMNATKRVEAILELLN